MRNCPNCGTAVREDAAFCRECGTRLKPTDDVRRCPNCGTPVRAEAAFCRECGTQLQAAGSTTATRQAGQSEGAGCSSGADASGQAVQPAGTELGRGSAALWLAERSADMRHGNDLGKSERMEDIAAPSEAGELVLSSWVEEPSDSEEDRSSGPKKASARASRARHRRS